MLLNGITKCNVEFKLDCDGIFCPKSITEKINKLSILLMLHLIWNYFILMSF